MLQFGDGSFSGEYPDPEVLKRVPMRNVSGTSSGCNGILSRRAKAKREREERVRVRSDATVRRAAMCAMSPEFGFQ